MKTSLIFFFGVLTELIIVSHLYVPRNSSLDIFPQEFSNCTHLGRLQAPRNYNMCIQCDLTILLKKEEI